jgi:predicted alpha/beta-hydrolase family hydrolase
MARSRRSPGAKAFTLRVDDATRVGALWSAPAQPLACYVLAHGAGAGMEHPFLKSLSDLLCARSVACLRFQFPYMSRGSRRPDKPAVCHATVRAAVAEAARRTPVPLFAGGKSFGGRMTSQAQAENPLAGVFGLAFVGFPLHPVGHPGIERAEHLQQVRIPMLFLQGTRDDLAELKLLRRVVAKSKPRASLRVFEGANHSFHVPARSGRTDAMVLEELADSLVAWIDARHPIA